VILKRLLLTSLVLLVFALHQDFWHWRVAHPLAFGFLPIGLSYHAGYTLLAALVMTLLVRFAWPSRLEQQAEQDQPPPEDRR